MNLNMEHDKLSLFSWFDYTIFGGMLGISLAIGVYFGFFGKKQNSADEYLKGGKQMSPIPVAISLIASTISTTTLLAVPAEIYRFGSNYVWLALGTIIECVIAYYVYLPVFFNLQVTSVFQYIHLRFDKKLKILISAFGAISMFVICPIVVYIPSLAFSQVSGVDVHLVAGATSVICIFYTAIGGCMEQSVEGQRLDILNFSFDPTLRDSFGALIIGGTVQWLTFTAIHQGSVQKILSVSTYKDVKKIMPVFSIGAACFHIFSTLFGLLLYGRYWNCDPLSTKTISRLEQLVPNFVMEVAQNFPGLPGVFIAGVYSAGLSTLSATLNTLSAVIYEDFISPFLPKTTSQKRISNILKLVVIICGTISTLLVLVFEKVPGIFSVYSAFMSVSLGPTLGIFSLGMLIPKANSKVAFFGALVSAIILTWITIQNQKYQSIILNEFIKPTSVDGCNSTIIVVETVNKTYWCRCAFSSGISSVICIFYTAVGGLKAVVWTDTLQFFIMVITFVIIFLMGLSTIGGFKFMWNKSVEGERLDIMDFSFDPTLRDSFGGLIIGGTLQWLTLTGIHQGSVQKILSVSAFKEVKKVMPVYTIGMVLIHIFATLFGLLLYARYWNCDPTSTKEISRLEQLVPHFVMEVAGGYPGLPGVFIAGVFSAGLSSLSAMLNTSSAVIYEDFISPFLSKNISQKRISNILKLIVTICGIISTLLVLVFEKIHGIFAVYTALMAVSLGPILAIFTLGMLVPRANSKVGYFKGAFYGGFFGIIFISYIFIQNQRHPIEELFLKPLSTEGCNISLYQNTTTTEIDLPFFLHRISFWLNTFIGGGVTVLVGVVISYFTAQDKHPVSKDLLTPLIHSFVKEPLRNNDQVELTPLEIDEKIRGNMAHRRNKYGLGNPQHVSELKMLEDDEEMVDDFGAESDLERKTLRQGRTII
ncbi:hypothetical protein FQR65_LT12720 [Abscondita terminalis]|nr:hypothetical protein FQR65_LT12720 [Abscondita terminalis]